MIGIWWKIGGIPNAKISPDTLVNHTPYVLSSWFYDSTNQQIKLIAMHTKYDSRCRENHAIFLGLDI